MNMLDSSLVDGVVHALAIVGGTWIVLQLAFSSTSVRFIRRLQRETLGMPRSLRGMLATGAECFVEVRRVRRDEAL